MTDFPHKGPALIDFTTAAEGFVPVARAASVNGVAWEEAAAGGATPAGSTGEVQFNDGGDLGACNLFLWEGSSATVLVEGHVTIGDPDDFFFDPDGFWAVDLNVTGFQQIVRHSDNETDPPMLFFIRSRGTAAVPTVSQSADELGRISFTPTATTTDDSTVSAMMQARLETGATGDTHQTQLSWWTHNGSALAERVTLNNTGHLSICGGRLVIETVPTSPANLPTGTIWSCNGYLRVV